MRVLHLRCFYKVLAREFYDGALWNGGHFIRGRSVSGTIGRIFLYLGCSQSIKTKVVLEQT
jgi:hypothetical protein